ncbi:unnamed protein product [Brachionus calyciflorus]|uniref:Bms1-type G domain-containing protein n=1 Tax=Brachionus calyciflorus TaxID=104777 RepID=A0A813YPF1_9BILA|nr:unnamed protein product [Brachionus calyciflorus]
MSEFESNQANKSHHRKQKGAKAKKRDNKKDSFEVNDKDSDTENKSKKIDDDDDDYRKAKARNPRAFALQSFVAAERQFRRTQDIKSKRLQLPEVDRTALEPPPIFVAIVGPPRVGKSILMQSLIKNYTRQKLNNIKGPVTVVTGKNRRITFYECNNDLNSMIDTAKVADLVLLLIDASFGFEMETFEFLNICQVHGFPRIMGVLTHMDMIKNPKALKKTKKKLKHRFWTEIYQGAKLFYLTGLVNNEYRRNEIHNLARFISVMKFKDLGYRLNHPFIICDRLEDLTQPDLIRQNDKCDRNVCLYGYVRGANLKNKSNVHIPGVGDFQLNDVSFLTDPCPLPNKETKRTLDDRERLVYAPFSGVGGIIYDKDAVYIELGGSHSHSNKQNDLIETQYKSKNPLLNQVIESKNTMDSKLESAKLRVFTDAPELAQIDMEQDDHDDNEDEEQQEEESDQEEEEEEEEDFESEDEEEDEENSEDLSEEENSEFDDEEEDDEMFGSVKWKENLVEKANISYANQNKRTNWSKVVYGDQALPEHKENFDQDDDDDDENLFKIKKINLKDYSEKVDNAKYTSNFYKWNNDEPDSFEEIKDCFVTGKWDRETDAAHLLAQDDEVTPSDFDDDGDDELMGDFEDMETGEVFNGNEDEDDEDEINDEQSNEKSLKSKKKPKSEMTKRERLLEKKKHLKEQFDREFDEAKSGDKTGESAYYDALAQEASQQTNLNRLEFERLDDSQRVEYEGFRVGMYVRIEINNMSCEFVKNFDAKYLSIVGCLDSNESNIGFVQVRLKKHRWHNKILKTKDPLVISLGWRRFQTLPVYYIQDHNMRNRSLKYTPQHMYCHASFWGPITPQGTGFLAVQTMSNETKNFRIAATGVVTETNKSTQIVKKLKVIGTPLKIFKKTAFLKGMFTSVIEASKFEGASIKTVSGIRGQIKKALHSSSVPAGSVRATFEDRIMTSDSVFLRTWYALEVPKFYAPITNLLSVKHEEVWQGVKTLGILKKENNIQVNPNEDSLYKQIVREEKVFAPLKIKRKLQEQLPFSLKTKTGAVQMDPLEKQRVAIIREPEEQKMASVMKMFKKVYENRVKAKNEHQAELIKKHKKEQEKKDLKRLQKSKELKKQVYRRLGKQEKRKNKYDKDD